VLEQDEMAPRAEDHSTSDAEMLGESTRAVASGVAELDALAPQTSIFSRRRRSKRGGQLHVLETHFTPGDGRVSVIVPTYREVQNIPGLVRRIEAVRASSGLDLTLLFVDDDSRDGSEELVRALGLDWVRMLVRTTDRGLSQAVLEGLRQSESEYLVVMDADLSHPPEKIPELIEALRHGADFALGSRFVDGGSTDDEWGLFRWLNSRVATVLARPLTHLKDPMSGFFSLRRETYLKGEGRFSPVGYKIGLELLVKCGCAQPAEVPIHFADRRLGKSKLSLKEQLRYIRHVRRLYNHRFGTWSHFAQFAFVGMSGVFVNLLFLTLFVQWGVGRQLAIGLSIALSMVWNFALNRRFSFSFARQEPLLKQFVGFIGACSIGGLANYVTTNLVWHWVTYGQVAAAIGVIAGMGFNFIVSRFLVFRTKHVRH
jgi:dolichol-phosphate mannosyltransferase